MDVVDTGSVKSDDGLECSSVPCRKVPVEADFLFSYSTVPGKMFDLILSVCKNVK